MTTGFDDLLSRSTARFESALEDARSAGPHGAEEIASRLGSVSGYRRVMMIVTLGDLRGGRGVSESLAEGLGPRSGWSTDERDAAILALAKRDDGRAEPVLRSAIRSSPDYALLCLARYGTERCRDDVLGYLSGVVRRKSASWRHRDGDWDRVVLGIVLLARLGSTEWLAAEVAPLLGGSHLDRLTEREVAALEELAPGGVDPCEPAWWNGIAARGHQRLQANPIFFPFC
ncbi:hypothetical protein GCM10023221_02700 [Luteimicrobium xylanilyticum]|uniref:HEAT repeat domain-containing protein n=1 Tax=Luteimicrobium xylanilyticum TaxID=1133546 RepID=A0A5P9Q7M3_9MICO|nr:hypothetical protein [Luteimicrobium xylanilyticum]QFU97434.1 hypothetical protein KDY119_00932 [Luteimicrobium xylanilyticum]